MYNIVGGHMLPFKLPTRFGYPTQRETEMRETKNSSNDYAASSKTPDLNGRSSNQREQQFARTDRNFYKRNCNNVTSRNED